MHHELGISHFLAHADFVARAIMAVLLAMSVASWYQILVKTLQIIIDSQANRRFLESFNRAETPNELFTAMRSMNLGSPLSRMVSEALSMSTHCRQQQPARPADNNELLTRTVRQAQQNEMARREHGLTFLAATASSTPFIGLFGTVWGIYHALLAIGLSGQGTLDKVAGPVGEALIMTAAGLAAAIPAALAYNFLIRANRSLSAAMNQCAHALFTILATGRRHTSGGLPRSEPPANEHPGGARA